MTEMLNEFPQRAGVIYLNHAAVSPWPRRTGEAVRRFAEENVEQGSLDYPQWLVVEQRLREQLQRLVGAGSVGEIALVKNTSEALSMVAYGLDWQPGDNIVSSNEEFPSNRIVWESLADQGVELRQADLCAGDSPEDALLARMDERTRLLAVSSVQYASGLRLDLRRLGIACRERGILFCIDAIQSLGAVPFDAEAVHADFVAADGHKWMMGPEGLGVFYCRATRRDLLRLNQYGWHMVAEPADYARRDWSVAPSSRRFECGSPNMLGIHALSASLSLLEEIGMDEVSRQLSCRVERLLEWVAQDEEIELLTLPVPSRPAGIVTFRHRRLDSSKLHAELCQRGVFCAHRGGGIRFSPHFYTPMEKIEKAINIVECVAKSQ